MRITHVTDCYAPRVGGIETQVSELARRQAAAGHEVTVVTATPATGDAARAASAIEVLRLRSIRNIGTVLEWLDNDVIHVHSAVVSPLAMAAAASSARHHRPVVVTVHSMWAYLTGPYRRLAQLGGLARLPITWTAVSRVAAREVQAALGGAVPVSVLPNGVDPSYWRSVSSKLRPAAPTVTVAAVMRLSARKRPLALLRALRQARDMLSGNTPLRAVIMGDGAHRPLVMSYARRHGMLDWVDLPGTGSRDQVRRLLQRADVFVAPARLESFGIAALEARCAGVPVVCGADTGAADFVVDGLDGLHFRDDAELNAALVRLVASPQLRGRLRANSRSNAVPFGWGVTMRAAENAYRRAVGAPVTPVAMSPVATG